MKKTLLLYFFLFFSLSCLAQLSKTHYIPPLTSNPNVMPQDHYIYISTPSLSNVKFNIIPIGGTVVSGTVNKNTPYRFTIGTGDNTQLFEPRLSTGLLINKGYIIESEGLVYVNVRTNSGNFNQAGGLVAKGNSALGKRFRAGAMLNSSNISGLLNFFSVLATENNTKITISNIPNGTLLANLSTFNGPTIINLNKNESYILAINDNLGTNLIGALIESDKDIVVNSGSFGGTNDPTNAVGGNGPGRDIGFDQIVGADKIGSDYIFIKGKGTDILERVLLIADTDNTDIYINGNSTPITTIQTGQKYVLDGSQFINNSLYIKTSKNVFAYQSIGGTTSNANQNLFFVPPLNCSTPKIVDNIPQINWIGSLNYVGVVNIVTETGATVTINDTPIASSPISIAGNPAFVFYSVTGLSNNVAVKSSKQVYVSYYGTNSAATYGSYYSGFDLKPELTIENAVSSNSSCLPNITLKTTPDPDYSFQWIYNNTDLNGEILNSLTPTIPGYYQVKRSIPGCTSTVLSDKIPVSNCPTDIDNDGIIDNVDIDNDNDGITNCNESFGNLNVNIANTTSGNIAIGNYTNTFTGTISTTGNASSNPFTGSADGSFISEIPAGIGNSATYSMSFDKPISLSMNYVSTANTTDLLNSDAEYIVDSDSDKTITILNPTNQLLIDTNYDGVYESGVTQFSSFEIRFRLNSTTPLAAGSGTFKLLTNLSKSLRITHKNLSDTNSNKSTLKIVTTCIPKDTDLDGIADQIDLDSDNDAILDNLEAQGKNFTAYSNIDANNDGLSDAYGSGINAVDTDVDGIVDYLDLDSDNDGIYDLVESGSNALDLNLDGIIDGIQSTFGTNGLSDSIETVTDSGVLNYRNTDTDRDGILNYLELDSDNDLCKDVVEAGFLDPNNDGLLGNTPLTVNTNGVVKSGTGYSYPNVNYITAAPIIITTQPIASPICELLNTSITIVDNGGNTYQWQVFNGTSWNDITNNSIYTGATTNTLSISNVSYTLNGNKYRVQLNKLGNSCGLISSETTLIVYPLLNSPQVSNASYCQNDNTIPLNATASINCKLNWYTSPTGGNGSNIAPVPVSTNAGTIMFYVSQINTTTGCESPRSEIKVTVNPLPIAPVVNSISYCQNSTANPLNVTPSANCTLKWYSTPTGGTANTTNPTPLTSVVGTTSYFVSQTFIDTGCEGPRSEIKVTINPLPIAPSVSAISFCLNTPAIPLSVTADTNCTLNWYTTSTGGTGSPTSPTPITSSSGITPYFVSQTFIDTGCEGPRSELKITVNPLPIVRDVTIVQCDSDSNPDGKTFFNLTVNNDLISSNYTNENFTYYTSQTGAINGLTTDLIVNDLAFENTIASIMSVWARITDKNTGCFSVAKLTLKVPATNILPSYKIPVPSVCDDFLDTYGFNNSNNNKRDGIATFDFSWTKAVLLSKLPTNQIYTINYYRNKADALAEINFITDISNYRNIGYPNSQDIWVRIESKLDNACVGLGPYVTLNVEALPIANSVLIPRQCDDNQDGIFNFDTSTLESTLLNGQTNVTVTYFDQNNSPLKDTNGITITSPFPSNFKTKSQTIKAVVTNNSTLKCFDETLIIFTVDDLPEAFPIPLALTSTCDDEPDPLNQDGNFAFDTSLIQSTILGTQSGLQVNYYDQNGNPLPSPLPNPLIISTQDITATVINPLNLSCTANTTIHFVVNPLPKINMNTNGGENELVCSNIPTFFVTLNAGIQDGSSTSNYTYIWSKDGNVIPAETNYNLNVNSNGDYLVKVTTAAGCYRNRSINVTASDIATINSIDIIDLSDANSVTVNVSGKGNYEFSLDAPLGPFQTSNLFENVSAGIHDVYVTDTNGCGTITEKIGVLGVPKFFTPNGDGYNDYWNVKGVNTTLNSKSTIYIFDRYGKLMKQLLPSSQGWDGTINGSPLPADDYWYSVQLEDGRELKGHFSLKR